MYPRLLNIPKEHSFFLFGPRGTGKSSWLTSSWHTNSYYIDLLRSDLYRTLATYPEQLERLIPPTSQWIVIDEVQRIPELLNEVHRLIEQKRLKFALSGSSARKLKRAGTNLLAGRASTNFLYPLTASELGQSFDLNRALRFGMLPSVWQGVEEHSYLESYVTTYLKEEVQQEGLTRNLGIFSRFLERASFSQAQPLNVSEVARDSGIDNKTAESYFTILEDLLLAVRLPVFTKHAKREMYQRAKFLYFDTGVYRVLRPKGPLDTPEQIDGAALETLLFQEMRALNDYLNLEYSFSYWRSRSQLELDFVAYGPRGLLAFEIKRSTQVRKEDLKAAYAFIEDYPLARVYVLYGGSDQLYFDNNITVVPFEQAIRSLEVVLRNAP
jgi:uncharacterized protein